MEVILKFQSTGSIPGNGDPVMVQGTSLTIGRGSENELVLPDPNRELSKRHCAIENNNGNVMILDFSTNGTFLNYGKLALGLTPTPLNNGDIISIGPYEILIEITATDAGDVIAEPVEEDLISHGVAINDPNMSNLMADQGDDSDFLEDLLNDNNAPAGPGALDLTETDEAALLSPLDDDFARSILDPIEQDGVRNYSHNPAGQDHFMSPKVEQPVGTIPDDWDGMLSLQQKGSNSFNGVNPDEFEHVEHAKVTEKPSQKSVPMPPNLVDNASRMFLEALGGQNIGISDQQLPETMNSMGNVLRILIEGIREILMTRASIKSEFRIEQTMFQVGGNNPLKFSISSEQAIETIVRPKAKGYLSADKAVSQALDDIKVHEVAMITGMDAALKGVLKKLDPTALEERMKSDSGLTGILKSRKVRYWELYKDMYTEIADQAENDFQELFAKEFSLAYQKQLDKLK
ncbi:MAG: type VI secretion system-associated FHA domain protein TagH [Pseudomonadales bacterium]